MGSTDGAQRNMLAVSELGVSALVARSLESVFDHVAATLSSVLAVDITSVFELLPDGERLLLRAGVGWREGCVGTATISARTGSQGGYTLLHGAPVVMEDVSGEDRLRSPS
jgi:hypothetical protein